AVRAVGQVDHPDRVGRVIVAVGDHPVDTRDHLRDVDHTFRAADLHRRQLDPGRHAPEPGRRIVAHDDPGQVGTVPERVEVAQLRRLGLERQVRAVDDVVGGQAGYRYHAGV